MLAPVRIDTIDVTLDLVLAHAAAVVAARQEALAGADHQESPGVEPRRPVRMREPATAHRARRLRVPAFSRPSGERELGDEIVDTYEIIAGRNHNSDTNVAVTIRSTGAGGGT